MCRAVEGSAWWIGRGAAHIDGMAKWAVRSLREDYEAHWVMRFIGLAAMTFGNLQGMVFTSKKVSLRVKNNVYLAMVLSVLLHGAAGSMALSRNQLSRPP